MRAVVLPCKEHPACLNKKLTRRRATWAVAWQSEAGAPAATAAAAAAAAHRRAVPHAVVLRPEVDDVSVICGGRQRNQRQQSSNLRLRLTDQIQPCLTCLN